MSNFTSRYGTDYAGQPNGCPDGMYPWDVDYPDDGAIASFEKFKGQAEKAQDCLNLPVSWYFNPEDEGGTFSLVFVMPRKYGKTWSMTLAKGYDRAEVEAWLETWTKKVAVEHYGWTEGL